MKIGFDLDGVLVNFIEGFNKRIVKVTGEDRFSETWDTKRDPLCWDYPQMQFGYTEAQIKRTWEDIHESRLFWRMLRPLPGMTELLSCNLWDHELYFITHRSRGKHVKKQTEGWLLAHDLWVTPTVIITPHKGSVCAALGLDCFIDDLPMNIENITHVSPGTRAYWLRRPWGPEGDKLPRIVNSVTEFLSTEGLLL